MDNPTAAMLVIGDEILSGRTRDANMHHLAERLSEHGIDLSEARIVSDCQRNIIDAVNELRSKVNHLFTSGGIGPTHDDITAESVAQALGVNIDVRQDARNLIAERCELYGLELNAARLRMARIPDGAELILNQVSAAPGFSIGNVHVMAGVPKIFKAMLEELLKKIDGGIPRSGASIVFHTQEGEIASGLSDIASHYPNVQIGSYPFHNENGFGVNVVVKGNSEDQVNEVEDKIRKRFANKIA